MSPETKLSRRTLAKSLGVGMAGLGTAGLIPAPYLVEQEVKQIHLENTSKIEKTKNVNVFDRNSGNVDSEIGLENFKPLVENPRYRRLYASAALFFLSIPLVLKGAQLYCEELDSKSN